MVSIVELFLCNKFILLFDILVDDGAVVPTIALTINVSYALYGFHKTDHLCSKVELVARVLWESTHESLETFPEVWCHASR
jgi:hypothetical protein